jgi:hypothetical protein
MEWMYKFDGEPAEKLFIWKTDKEVRGLPLVDHINRAMKNRRA